MHFVGPEHRVRTVFKKRVAVELALGFVHQLAHATHRHFASCAFRVKRVLELVTHRDVHEIRVGAQHFLVEEVGLGLRGDVGIVEQAVEQNHFAKIGRGLCERHGILRGE